MSAAKRAEARPLEDDDDDLDILSGEYEIIPAKQELKKKAQSTRRRKVEPDPVAAAEAALEKMAQNFAPWMASETETLLGAWRAAERAGFDEDARDTLYRAAHDIKGQAATLGFPIAGQVAKSLCHLLDNVPDPAMLPASLVGQHVQAIRAMVAENAREDGNPVARALSERLAEVTDDYIARLD